MKLKPHGYFLVSFVISFVDGEISRHEFDMDYSGYVIEHFPNFRKEHPRLANRFADTIDVAYELGERKSDEALRDAMANALDDCKRLITTRQTTAAGHFFSALLH